jgi:secondary thiamine-phosphate synthase enzyme
VTIIINSSDKDEVIDITSELEGAIKNSEIENGICNIFVKHTSCALACADLDPGTDLDLLSFLREIQPNINFNHPHDPEHAPDHLLSSIIGNDVTVPFNKNGLILGTWQRIVLVELNGPRKREIELTLISAAQ